MKDFELGKREKIKKSIINDKFVEKVKARVKKKRKKVGLSL